MPTDTPDPADVELVIDAIVADYQAVMDVPDVDLDEYRAAARPMAVAVLSALAAAGRLLPPDTEPDLWEYGMPDPDEGPDAVMTFEGRPRYISPRYLRRPLRAIGPWLPVPNTTEENRDGA